MGKQSYKTRQIRIGFAYDEPQENGGPDQVETVAAEYEDERTLSWMRSVLQTVGPVTDLPWGPDVAARFAKAKLDVVFNVTEATSGRNRESLLPALAEAKGVPCIGTDAVGLGIALDKYLTKVLARHEGVPTPDFIKIDSACQWEKLVPGISALSFPVIAKPNTGGSSMGIRRLSKAESMPELHTAVKWVLDNFEDSVLVEEFVPGREFAVGLLAGQELQTLPIIEIRVADGSPDSFYSYERKTMHDKELVCPADVPGDAEPLMADYAQRIFHILGCRDLARVDFRLGTSGIPYFLEINPLPGLSPYYGIFPAQARAAGFSPEEVIHQLVYNAMNRDSGG